MTGTAGRKLVSSLFVAFCALSVLGALVPLGFVLFFVVGQGIRSVTLDFFLQLPKPVGEPGGGMANAIAGTLMLSGLAALMAVPIGVVTVVLPAALPGIITGIVLALARIAGETAPLLFTSFNNRFFNTDPRQPTAALTVQIYNYAIAPYDDWHRQAWAGALVLVTIVLVCSLLARLATRRLERMHAR